MNRWMNLADANGLIRSGAALSLAGPESVLMPCPVTFGEVGDQRLNQTLVVLRIH